MDPTARPDISFRSANRGDADPEDLRREAEHERLAKRADHRPSFIDRIRRLFTRR
jgi:hypothetical protein